MFGRLILLISLFTGLLGHAQDDGSLTKEFAGLSAKERSRLAKAEVDEAGNDMVFQEMMSQAEVAFKAGRFDEARQHYADARTRRPLNVYPKVKLEDLDALIAKRAAEEAARTAALEPAPLQPPPTVTALDTIPHAAPPPPVAAEPKPIAAVQKKPAPKHAEPEHTQPEHSAVGQAGPEPLPIEGERNYMEGNAKVLEITVTEQGRLVVYKKVQHQWGQVFFFKDGGSVGQRVWQERFGTR